MKTIEQQLTELEERIKRIEVSKDEHAAWLEHKVTKRFLLESQYAMMLALDLERADDYAETIDQVALTATRRRAIKSTYEDVITWQPDNFIDE